MSITRFSGDLVTKFGKLMPTPFIEKVVIDTSASTGVTELKINLAFYFDLNEWGVGNFADYMSDFTTDQYAGIGLLLCMQEADSPDRVYDNLVSGKWSILEGISNSFLAGGENYGFSTTYEGSEVYGGSINGFQQVSKSNLFFLDIALSNYEEETFYDAQNNPIKKITFRDASLPLGIFYDNNPDTKLINMNTLANLPMGGDPLSVLVTANFLSIAEVVSSRIEKMGLLSFSYVFGNSAESQGTQGTQWNTYVDGMLHDPPLFKAGRKKVFESGFSNAGFITLTTNGSLVTSEEDIFINLNGDVIDNVIQSLDGDYYEQDDTLLDTIRSDIAELASFTTDDWQLQSVYDNINYILQLYGSDVFLLRELNEFRRTFPDKSTTTPVGRFYNVFRNKIADADFLVRKGVQVRREIISNPRIINLRESIFQQSQVSVPLPYFSMLERGEAFDYYADGTAGIPTTWNRSYAYIYPGATRYTREMLKKDNEYLFKDFGFFFFDYEKALKFYSKISHICDVTKLENFYGKEVVSSTYRLRKASVYLNMYKTADADGTIPISTGDVVPNKGNDWDEVLKMTSFYNTNLNLSNPAPQSFTFQVEPGNEELADESYNGGLGNQCSYITLRGFRAATLSGLDVSNKLYRLMCFEFQKLKVYKATGQSSDWQSDFEAVTSYADNRRWFYEFEVTIQDRSELLFYKIKQDFENIKESFEHFAGGAMESCSSTMDGFLSDFFIEGVEERYRDNPEEAPWNRAPLLIEFYDDLFFDRYSGDIDKIYRAAANSSTKLNPKATTTEQLSLYLDRINSLDGIITGEGSESTDITPHSVYSAIPGISTPTDYVVNSEIVFGRRSEDATETSCYTVTNLRPYQDISNIGMAAAEQVVQTGVSQISMGNDAINVISPERCSLLDFMMITCGYAGTGLWSAYSACVEAPGSLEQWWKGYPESGTADIGISGVWTQRFFATRYWWKAAQDWEVEAADVIVGFDKKVWGGDLNGTIPWAWNTDEFVSSGVWDYFKKYFVAQKTGDSYADFDEFATHLSESLANTSLTPDQRKHTRKDLWRTFLSEQFERVKGSGAPLRNFYDAILYASTHFADSLTGDGDYEKFEELFAGAVGFGGTGTWDTEDVHGTNHDWAEQMRSLVIDIDMAFVQEYGA